MSSHLRADTLWSVCPGQGVHAGYLFICARDLFDGATCQKGAPIELAASPVWLPAKSTGIENQRRARMKLRTAK